MKKDILLLTTLALVFNFTMIFEKGSFYLPLRTVLEDSGYTVYYDENITVSTKGDKNLMIINSNKDTYINYNPLDEEQKPILIENSTYAPVSLFNSLGYDVKYNFNDGTVTLEESQIVKEDKESTELGDVINYEN